MMQSTGEVVVKAAELNLKLMLASGQSFRWKEIEPTKWIGVVSDFVLELTQLPDKLLYKIIGKKMPDEPDRIISNYLRLDSPIDTLYEQWSVADPNFKKLSVLYTGLRLLDQEPHENLFSFICSSNNNIPRISKMIEGLCKNYGEFICDYNEQSYYKFPTIEKIATSPKVEDKLRKLGFGYRAPYITETAKQLFELGAENYLNDLKHRSYTEAKKELIKFRGIGPKVADCICLMSLGHLSAVPIDTHIFEIAKKYLPHLDKLKYMPDKHYNEIGDFFRKIYGDQAGWAHLVLFCSDLNKNTSLKRTVKSENQKPKRVRIKKEKIV